MIELLRNPEFRAAVNAIIIISCVYIVYKLVVYRVDDRVIKLGRWSVRLPQYRLSRSWTNWLLALAAIGTGGNAANVSIVYYLAPQVNTLGGLPTPVFYTLGDMLGAAPFVVIALAILMHRHNAKLTEISRILATHEQELEQEIAQQRSLNQRLSESNAELNETSANLKAANAELTASEARLSKVAKQLKYYIDVLAHDLRTPITTIKGFVDLILSDFAELVETGKLAKDAQVITDFNYIENATDAINEIVESLRIYNQVANGDTLERELISSGGVVEKVLSALTSDIKAAQAMVLFEKDDLPPVWATSLVNQVFQNIIANAIKYRDPSRPLVIDINAKPKDGMIEFSIVDNGIGFLEEDASKIFDIFKSAHQDKMGRGIGLSIARDIVEGHGGQIWAKGDPGEGAAFYFTLPSRGES